jgi:hypothetical protein
MRDAKDYFGKSAALLIALEGEGIRGRGGERYAEANVSKWISGETGPPSNVLLTAARLAGIRVDDYLYPGGRETDKADRERLETVENELKELREGMMKELEHIHEEMRNQSRKLRASTAAQASQLDEGARPA